MKEEVGELTAGSWSSILLEELFETSSQFELVKKAASPLNKESYIIVYTGKAYKQDDIDK